MPGLTPPALVLVEKLPQLLFLTHMRCCCRYLHIMGQLWLGPAAQGACSRVREWGWGLHLYPQGLCFMLLLQACKEKLVSQVLGRLQGQQRGRLLRGLHGGPRAQSQVHGLPLRAGHVHAG